MPRNPQPNAPQYGIDALYVFPYFSTREAYRLATGKEAPPYDDTKRVKYWQDVDALTADPDEPLIYDVAYNSRGGVFSDANGKPKLGKLAILPEEAYRLNIPEKKVGVFPGSTSGIEVQPPCGALFPNEELVFQAGIASAQIMVKRTDMATPPAQATMGDVLALLQKIAAKVGA